MRRILASILVIITVLAAIFVLVGTYKGADTSAKDNSGVLAKPRPRHSREPDRQKLVTDARGNLVSLPVFEANLKLDGSFSKGTPDYKLKLLASYSEIALLANPEQAIAFLRENQAAWVGDPSTAPTIISQIASTLGLDATREFLDIIPTRDILTNIITRLSLDLKDGESLAMVDFFLGYDATLLENEAVMGNLMLLTGGGIDRLTELFRKLPKCKERTSAAEALAQSARSLGTKDYITFYKGISPHLSPSEMHAMHTTLTENMDSIADPKLAFLLTNGYQGNADNLLAVAAKSADLDLDNALQTLTSLDASEQDRNAMFSGILRSWAQYAPKKAAQYAYSSFQSGQTDNQAMNVVYGEWIKRDTPAAVSYYNRLELDKQSKTLIDLSNFPNVASYSTRDGLTVLQERQNDPDYPPDTLDHLRRDFALSDGAHHSSEVVLGELAKIKDPTIRESAYSRFSTELASVNLFKAVSLAAQTTIPSQRDQMLMGAFVSAVSYDLKYSHDMIHHISDPGTRENAYKQWHKIALRTEPHLAAEWQHDLKNSMPQLYEKIFE